MSDIQTKLASKYGGGSFYDLQKGDNSITCLREDQLKNILYRTLEGRHGRNMLAQKSKELISKLDLI